MNRGSFFSGRHDLPGVIRDLQRRLPASQQVVLESRSQFLTTQRWCSRLAGLTGYTVAATSSQFLQGARRLGSQRAGIQLTPWGIPSRLTKITGEFVKDKIYRYRYTSPMDPSWVFAE